jgi:hypothetical protein
MRWLDMLHTNLSQWETLHAPHRAGPFLCLKFANFVSERKEVIHTALHVVYSMQADVLSKKSGNNIAASIAGTSAGLGYLEVNVICPCKSPHWAIV